MSGILILGLLIAGVVLVFLRGPGRRMLLGGMPGVRQRNADIAQLTDQSMRIGGPFSDAEFGGFGGAGRQVD